MNILHISLGIYPVTPYGTQIYTAELAYELIEQGLSVVVAIPESIAYLEARVAGSLPAFVELLRTAPHGTISEKLRLAAFGDPLWKADLRALIERVDPQVIHVQHALGFGLSLFSVLAEFDIPVVIGIPDYWLVCPGYLWKCTGSVFKCANTCCRGLRFGRMGYFARLALAVSHRYRAKSSIRRTRPYLAAISPRTKYIFESEGFPKELIHLHPWGIDLHRLSGSRRPTVESIKEPRIGYLGTLREYKGCHVLAEAFVKAQPLIATLHFHGGGDQGYIDSLKKQFGGQNVTFHGQFDHASVWKILGSLDIVVIPSIWEETYCLVVQEALAAHKVIIASDTGGIADRVVHGVNGFLVPPNDVFALSREISRVVSCLNEITPALDFDRGLFDIRDDARNWISIYRKLAGRLGTPECLMPFPDANGNVKAPGSART